MAALVNKLPSLPSSSSSHQFRNPNSFNLNPIRSVRCTSSSPSPFTEKHSIERYQRDNWLYKNPLDRPDSSPLPPPDPCSIRDYDVALQLPELKKLLEVLREKRGSGGSEGGGRGPGNVFLVGTGPGDPELLTVKAVRVIGSADLLLYDRLVSNEVLNLLGPDARLLYVGKTAGYHSRTQEEIHELLLSFAEAGANVVRLKGGDPLVSYLLKNARNKTRNESCWEPCIFCQFDSGIVNMLSCGCDRCLGGGGEEMDFLQQQGIRVQVIPGMIEASAINSHGKEQEVRK